MYNTLNNPKRTPNGLHADPKERPYTPQDRGYADVAAPRVAEAIRAYVTDPNWLKAVATQTAARIRQFVNNHPDLSTFIQFNTLAAIATMNGLAQAPRRFRIDPRRTGSHRALRRAGWRAPVQAGTRMASRRRTRRSRVCWPSACR